jgi:prepilin-type N-terminal cleavage/methylation domain-containing protein
MLGATFPSGDTMKKQSGFTLIELLLVLAIIGIISAIAIPALLGQRARARDKSCVSNADSIMADMVGQWDKLKEGGTAPAGIAAIIGSSGAPLIPQAFTATNPWGTATYLGGYNVATFATEVPATPGTATAAKAAAATLGQVQLGFVAPAATTAGVIASSVYVNAPFTVAGAPTNNYTKTAGID